MNSWVFCSLLRQSRLGMEGMSVIEVCMGGRSSFFMNVFISQSSS